MSRLKLNHGAVARRLRRVPGEWMTVRPYPMRHAAVELVKEIRSGARPEYAPRGAFEAKVRFVDGVPTVFARYVAVVLSPDRKRRAAWSHLECAYPRLPALEWAVDDAAACVVGRAADIASLLPWLDQIGAGDPVERRGIWSARGTYFGDVTVVLIARVAANSVACRGRADSENSPARGGMS